MTENPLSLSLIEKLKEARGKVSMAFKNRIFPLGSLPYSHGERCLQEALIILDVIIRQHEADMGFSGCQTAGRSNEGESGANASKGVTAGETVNTSEISADEWSIQTKLLHNLSFIDWRTKSLRNLTVIILSCLRPYLRTTEPVSVSLETKNEQIDAVAEADELMQMEIDSLRGG